MVRTTTAIALITLFAALPQSLPPRELPAAATKQLSASLAAARPRASHLWRDTLPINPDGTVNAYIEIPRGERRKYEFDMNAHARVIDRVMPEHVGGYPINYGFVPQTVSYDGDPFDALVLGPALPGGRFVRGVAIAVMHMEDEKGLDSKVVLSPVNASGRPRYALELDHQTRVGTFFATYKRHEPGKFSKVPGWGTADEGLAFVKTTHAFFRDCRNRTGLCRLN